MDDDNVTEFRGRPGIGLPSDEDWSPLFNSHEWMRKAVQNAGANVTGGGVGCGVAELQIIIDGCKFNITITPIIKQGE